MLEVEHVSKKFKDHQVLVDVNLKGQPRGCRRYFGAIWIRKNNLPSLPQPLGKGRYRSPHPRWKRV